MSIIFIVKSSQLLADFYLTQMRMRHGIDKVSVALPLGLPTLLMPLSPLSLFPPISKYPTTQCEYVHLYAQLCWCSIGFTSIVRFRRVFLLQQDLDVAMLHKHMFHTILKCFIQMLYFHLFGNLARNTRSILMLQIFFCMLQEAFDAKFPSDVWALTVLLDHKPTTKQAYDLTRSHHPYRSTIQTKPT